MKNSTKLIALLSVYGGLVTGLYFKTASSAKLWEEITDVISDMYKDLMAKTSYDAFVEHVEDWEDNLEFLRLSGKIGESTYNLFKTHALPAVNIVRVLADYDSDY